MHNTTGGRNRTGAWLSSWCLCAVALSVGTVAGCSSDGFVPPDGGIASGGSGSGGQGTGGATAKPMTVVEACAAVCKAQYQGRCQRIEITTEQCDGVCSFLEAASMTCQSSTKTAFECQLDNDPCKTTNCNDLLKKAETDCPEKSAINGMTGG